MKIVRERFNKDGSRVITLRLKKDELVQVYEEDAFYKLGGQMDDVVPSWVVNDAQKVRWDHFEQKWVTA